MGKIKFDRKKPIISLILKINNKGKIVRLKMALDTGATYCMIPWKFADMLKLQPSLSTEILDITTASGVITVPLVTVYSMSVANNEVKKVTTLVHDLPPKSFVDGLLGASFLSNFELCINYKKGYFELK